MATAAGSGARLGSARGNKKISNVGQKNVNYSYVRGLNIKTYLLYSDVFIFYCSFLSLAYKKKRSMLLVGGILTNVRETATTFDGNDVGRRNVILGE